MKTWTPGASEMFEAWLGRVRLSVAGDPSVDPEDVAQDLRAHVHAELEAISEPITVGALERVLDSLGNPTQWSDAAATGPEPQADWFQRNIATVIAEWQQKLAGDWGSPVMLAALTAIAILTFDWVGAPLLLFAYFAGRSIVKYTPQPLTGRRKWLVYFPLAVGAGVLTGLVLAFPLTFSGNGPVGRRWMTSLWLLGSWWILIGFAAAREPKRVRSALMPFADAFDASHGRMLARAGAAFLIAATVLLIST